jgi:Predicted glycosyl hydrolase
MKRTIFIGIVLALIKVQTVFSQEQSYDQLARHYFHKVWNYYRVPQYGLFAEFYPQAHTDTLTYLQQGGTSKVASYLWPLSGIVSACNRMIKLPGGSQFLPYLDSAMMAMEQYRDTLRHPPGYQAYPARFEKVDRYYDDNGLVAIDYAEAYLSTGNPVYLKRAKDVFRFILSGWSDDMGGGVSWLEGHRDQKPACSNGMATLAALKLYSATKERYYLNWGKKFYNWMKCLRQPPGIYANDIKTKDSSINKTYYTYNSGSMLEASVLLYQFTSDTSYLNEARTIAQATLAHFGKKQADGRIVILDLPWFVTVLFRGYEALYHIDKNSRYIQIIRSNIDYACKHGRDKYGLFNTSWTNSKDEYEKPKWLLDEACMVELFARLALLEGKQ